MVKKFLALPFISLSLTTHAAILELDAAQYRIDVLVEGCNINYLDCHQGESAYFDISWAGGTVTTLNLGGDPSQGSGAWSLDDWAFSLTTQSGQTYVLPNSSGSASIELDNNFEVHGGNSIPDWLRLAGRSSPTNEFSFRLDGDYGFAQHIDDIANIDILNTSEILNDNSFAEFDGYQIDFLVTGISVSTVPLPATAWLFGSALAALAGLGRKRKKAA